MNHQTKLDLAKAKSTLDFDRDYAKLKDGTDAEIVTILSDKLGEAANTVVTEVWTENYYEPLYGEVATLAAACIQWMERIQEK